SRCSRKGVAGSRIEEVQPPAVDGELNALTRGELVPRSQAGCEAGALVCEQHTLVGGCFGRRANRFGGDPRRVDRQDEVTLRAEVLHDVRPNGQARHLGAGELWMLEVGGADPEDRASPLTCERRGVREREAETAEVDLVPVDLRLDEV